MGLAALTSWGGSLSPKLLRLLKGKMRPCVQFPGPSLQLTTDGPGMDGPGMPPEPAAQPHPACRSGRALEGLSGWPEAMWFGTSCSNPVPRTAVSISSAWRIPGPQTLATSKNILGLPWSKKSHVPPCKTAQEVTVGVRPGRGPHRRVDGGSIREVGVGLPNRGF